MQFLVSAVSGDDLAETITDNSHLLSCLSDQCLTINLSVPTLAMGLIILHLLSLRVALQDSVGLMVDMPSQLRYTRLPRFKEGFPD